MDLGWGYGTEQRLRDENQDAFGIFELPGGRILAVVCDGMGGHAGGAQASAMAVRIIHDKAQELVGVPARDLLEAAITDANRQIYDTSRRSHRLMGMGTTVVAALVEDDHAVYIAHVGDSRAYLVRGDQAEQLTRDHTMVNLFVEAELLSPEDAASHPEAHVLARSLGVERTVDVEHHAPLEPRGDDAVVLCSDGVHGLLTEWEFGRVNWQSPQQGIRKVLQMVNDREGDDNATIISLGFGDQVQTELPFTPPPETGNLSDTISGATSQAQSQPPPLAPMGHLPPPSEPDPLGMDSLGDLPPPPGMHDEPESLEPHDVDLEELDPDPIPLREPLRFEEPAPRIQPPDLGAETSGLVDFNEPQTRAAEADASTAMDARPASPSILRLGLIAGGAALAVLLLGLLGIGGYTLLTSSDPAQAEVAEPTPEPAGEAADVVMEEGGSAEPVGVTSDVEIEPEITFPTPAVIGDWSFQPLMPKPARRLPHNPKIYTQPAPYSTHSEYVLKAIRDSQCAEAHRLMAEEAMRSSTAFAQYYNDVWQCFSTHHASVFRPRAALQPTKIITTEPQRQPSPPLVVTDLSSFGTLLVHFQGETLPKKPWGTPALDGIEYRIEAFEASNEVDLFSDVILDLHGEAWVADELGRDLLVEAQAAEALSRLPAEYASEQTTLWWARRVYVVRRALDGRTGALVKAHVPDLAKQIEATLAKAVPLVPEPVEGQPPPVDPVPPLVRQALVAAAAEGEPPEPALDQPKPPQPGTTTPKPRETSLEDLWKLSGEDAAEELGQSAKSDR